jgi:tetratricopeptide (TPR) repeat protein
MTDAGIATPDVTATSEGLDAGGVQALGAHQNEGTARRYVLRAVAAIAVPILMLILVEMGLRFFDVGYSTELLQPCTIHGRAASCYNLFFPAPFFPPGMIKTPQLYSIPAEKASGTYRIFVLGESAAMGDPDPAYGFSRYLDVMLRERFPQMKFEVVNTGSVAINSHVLLPIAKGLAEQHPDLFIIYSGNNEVVGPFGPGTALSSSAMSLPVIRANLFVRKTRIGQLLTQVGTPKREWGGMEMFLDKQVPASSPLMKPTYANFARNLRDTIDAAREAGAHVIVTTVATNLRDCGPFGSQHRDGLSAADLANWSALVQQGVNFEEAQSYDQALKAYSAARQIDDQYAELEFRIARALWKIGDHSGAKQHFSRARDLDTLRFRADSTINDINRRVAASAGTEVELVDTEQLFAQNSRDGIVGAEMVYEHVHLRPAANYSLARALFERIAAQLNKGGTEVPSEEECEKLLAFTGYDRARLRDEMQRRLQSPPFTMQLNHSEQLMRLAMEEQAPETPESTARAYQWAIGQKPDDRVLHYNFGQFLYNYNRAAGAQELKAAQPWDGFPVYTPDGMRIQ